MVAAVDLFGMSLGELAIIAVAVGYVASLARDWRPMRSLREENRGLREDLDAANRKIQTLEAKVDELEGRTDLTRIAEAMQLVVTELRQLSSDVKSNTAAVEVLAKGHSIADALTERRSQE